MSNEYFFTSRLALKEPLEYVKNKRNSVNNIIDYMQLRLLQMFEYTNLPETIPKEFLEMYLLMNGTCFITEVDGKLYALIGTFGGTPDPYYLPTRYIVANPALKLSKDYSIKDDGVLMKNDKQWKGLYPLMCRYASLMGENLLTIRSADIMLRAMNMITAPDDRTKIAADEYLSKLENGEFCAVADNKFFDGIQMQGPPSNNGSYLTQFIELHQYLTGTFYNEIGINANFNMKRESIGVNESALNEDSLLPLCEHMLVTRQECVKKINEKYNTNISVDFSSIWKQNVIENELELEVLRGEANGENNEQSPSNDNGFEEGNGDNIETDGISSGDDTAGCELENATDGTSTSEEVGENSNESVQVNNEIVVEINTQEEEEVEENNEESE